MCPGRQLLPGSGGGGPGLQRGRLRVRAWAVGFGAETGARDEDKLPLVPPAPNKQPTKTGGGFFFLLQNISGHSGILRSFCGDRHPDQDMGVC